MNDCITTTKQSTTKPCAYFLGYTVSEAVLWYHWLGGGWSITSAKCNSTSLTWKAIQLNYRWVKGKKRGLINQSLYRWDYLSIILIIAGWAWLSKLYLRWNSISRHKWWLITQWLCRCDYLSIVLSHCEFNLVYICQQISPLRSTKFNCSYHQICSHMQRLLFMIFPLDRTWTQTQSLWTPPPVTPLPHSWAYHGPISHRLSWDVLQVKSVNPLILKKSSSRDMLL